MFSFGKENQEHDQFSAELQQLFARIQSRAESGPVVDADKLATMKERATLKAWEALISSKH